MRRGSAEGWSGRIVVVSPHLDDAVFSLGAAIAQAARAGSTVEVLTVLGGDPRSDEPAGDWDRRAGYDTSGEAASRRREEDRRACAVLGARPVWLPYGYGGDDRRGDDRQIREAVAAAVEGADAVLLPGFPLHHRDHAWLTALLVWQPVPCRQLGLYVEQPYAFWLRSTQPASIEALDGPLPSPARLTRISASVRDRHAKWKAIRAYRSQLPLLGMTGKLGGELYRLLWSEMRLGGEGVAWWRDR